LLIIVAFLSILVGALMTELTNSFLISRTHVARMEREATLSSAVELGIHQLQTRTVPANCATDIGSLPSVSLNGSPASVSLACHEIWPDVKTTLALGSFRVDGIHDTSAGRNRYLVADATGLLYAYQFAQTSPSWTIALGGALTAAPLPIPSSPAVLLAPVARPNSGCAGHCVALYTDGGGAPALRCIMPASTTVSGTPAIEVPAGGNFPTYAFFAGSDPGSSLYVYEASAGGGCAQERAQNLGGGGAVGAPLVFPGPSRRQGQVTTTTDDIFVVVSDGTNTSLQHWQYQEAVDSGEGGGEGGGGNGGVTKSLNQLPARSLTALVGGRAVGYAISTPVPPLSLAVAGATGRMGIARITVGSGPSYTMSTGAGIALGTAITRPPSWSQGLIAVGGASGRLFLLNPSLVSQWTYDGAADGFPAINSTPAVDANGDWYFGADDGYVYDVEIPGGSAPGQLFKAARFGPGGAIRSSPVVGTGAGCNPGPCMYFGSATAGSYFAQIGLTRIVDLRACASSTPCSTTAVPNPRLWARVEVGTPFRVGGRGVYVQGWSYYSP
jgi:hypothetical protein